MKQTNKKKLEEFIRVDHAGERGAIKIYEGQLLALNTLVNNDDLKQKIYEMKKHEEEHSNFFDNEIEKRNINPTKLLPLWDLLGLGLGFGSTILGKKAAMLCTASVEEVIDEHYKNQINQIEVDEKDLKEKIIKFRQDKEGATKKGLYSCQYCGDTNELTFDHLLPRSKGGKTNWDNVVTACSDCNVKKGGRLLKDSDMKLNQWPFQPTTEDLHKNGKNFPPNFLHKSWMDYLYWDVELEP